MSTALLRHRPAGCPRRPSCDRPGDVPGGLRGDPAGHQLATSSPASCRSGTTPGSGCWPGRCTGFAETFSQYMVEVAPGGGSDRPEPDPEAEGVALRHRGTRCTLTVDGDRRTSSSRAATPTSRRAPTGRCATRAATNAPLPLDPQGLRAGRRAGRARGVRDQRARRRGRSPMPGHRRRWATTRFVDPADLRHDMHVNIVTFEPGGAIPFPRRTSWSTGSTSSRARPSTCSTSDWVEVQEGDFMWLRAFCPQACYAGGPGPVPLPALQGRQPAHEAEQPDRLSRPPCSGRPLELEPHTFAAVVLLAAPAVGHGRDQPQAVAALRCAGLARPPARWSCRRRPL